MDVMVVFVFAACVTTIAVLWAWAAARTIGDNQPSTEENEAILPSVALGVLVGAAALTQRHDWVMAVVAAFFAIVGVGVGGSVGWLTRDCSDSEQF